MFLKTLTLKGFKSFAESTVLDMEPGVTVVVGPNGSGKSNVVDAIAWVLGAQAPSAVRSQKMDDVIFAGTAKRQALGRAEVALTIDNSAGLLPIDFSEVTLTRTLFRSGDSEYAVNGVPCRLLDIQELLSDTGVGRQQHTIISQGQIDAVLNARPEERRLIVEEAAGILKYRRRKEKAERRLAATESNLVRVQDLLREVRRQLRPLERQAEAARRHGALADELLALRRHLAGRQLTGLRQRLETGGRGLAGLHADESALKATLAELDATVFATEAQLGSMGAADLGDDLMRFESLRERARGLVAVLAERRRSLERERGAAVDAAVIASLEAEAAQLAADLASADGETLALEPMRQQLADAEAALADERSRFETQWAGGVTPPTGQAAETRGELSARHAAVEGLAAEMARVRTRVDAIRQRLARLDGEHARLRAELAEAADRELPLVESLTDAERRRSAAESAADAAESALRAVESERHRWTARAEALGQALDEARARAGAAALAQVSGVVGTVLDLVDIDEGYEAAFEAAAGEALAAVVVDNVDAARRALAALHGSDASGAVLALDADRANPLSFAPALGEQLRAHVRSPRADVEQLLDVLVGSVVVVDGGWEEAVDAAIANRGAVIVTLEGDRFGPTGWRVGGPATGATGVALDEARQRALTATDDAAAAAERLAVARAELSEARRVETELSKALDENDSRLAAARDSLTRIESDRRDAQTEGDSLGSHLDELAARLARDEARVAELSAALPALEANETEALERGRTMAEARSQLDGHAVGVAALRTDLDVRSAALNERRQLCQRRLSEVEARLERDVAERHAAESRRIELAQRTTAVDRLHTLVTARLAVVEVELGELRARRQQQSEQSRAVAARLDTLRHDRTAAERSLDEVRERSRRAELDAAETRMRLDQAVEACRHDLDCEPDTAMAAPVPELADGVTAQGRVRELERELRLMGPVNPLAIEEFEALLRAPRVPAGPARRRQGQPARTDEGDPRGRRRDRGHLRHRVRRCRRELRDAVRHAVPGRPGRAGAHRPREPARHGHRGGGPPLGQERPQAVVAVGRRAFAGGAGVPVRRLP